VARILVGGMESWLMPPDIGAEGEVLEPDYEE
jgi:hypothetical protein